MITTETWLPVFPGFYETEFDIRYQDSIDEDIRELFDAPEEQEKAVDFFWSLSNAEKECTKNYGQEVAKTACKVIEKELKELELICQLDYQRILSPREYNFSTDAIYIEIVLNKKNVENIKKIIDENSDKWTEYLKDHYTSGPGFASWHENFPEAEEWQVENAVKDKHNLGSIFEFICGLEGMDTISSIIVFYEEISVYPYVDTDKFKKEFQKHLEKDN